MSGIRYRANKTTRQNYSSRNRQSLVFKTGIKQFQAPSNSMKRLMREIVKVITNEDLFFVFWCELADVNPYSFTFIKFDTVKYVLV